MWGIVIKGKVWMGMNEDTRCMGKVERVVESIKESTYFLVGLLMVLGMSSIWARLMAGKKWQMIISNLKRS